MEKLRHYLLVAGGLLFFAAVVSVSTALIGNGSVSANPAGGIDLMTMEPFQQAVTVTLNAGQSGVNVPVDVPSGKLFVVEQVSAYGSAPSDQRIELSLATHIAPDLTNRSHYLLADKQTVSGTSYYRTSQMVKIYADTPYVNARVSRSTAPDTVTFRFTVSGYFVNK